MSSFKEKQIEIALDILNEIGKPNPFFTERELNFITLYRPKRMKSTIVDEAVRKAKNIIAFQELLR